MNYSPRLGDIGLVTIKGDVGLLIRLGQWLNGDGFENYEHVLVYVGDGDVVQAEPGGAQRVRMPYKANEVEWISCPPEHGPAVAQAAIGLVGTPYSWLDYFSLAALRLHIRFKALRNYVASTRHMICSQLAVVAAAAGGWVVFPDKRLAQDVTPGDLWQLRRWLKGGRRKPLPS